MNEVENRLKEINIENYIWVLYIGIILLSWYSNYKEKDYLIYKNEESKRIYRNILIFIFIILVIVYSYFVIESYKSIMSLKTTDTEEKKSLTYIAYIASILIFISGVLFLYVAILDKDIETELAFN